MLRVRRAVVSRRRVERTLTEMVGGHSSGACLASHAFVDYATHRGLHPWDRFSMKFKVLLAGFAALSLSASTFAQAPDTGPGDFSAEAFRAHITFLADDLLEGRDTG